MNLKENEYLSSLEALYRGKIDFYTKKLDAILILKEEETVGLINSEGRDLRKETPFNVPLEFDKYLTQDQKVYFALRNIEVGFVEDVAKELVKLDNAYDIESAKNLATQKLSKLKGENKIDFIKMGVKYKYMIKK